jgi:hypothetical protein
LDGADSNDTLTGGVGAVVFEMSKGNDIVTDFRYEDGDEINVFGGGTTDQVNIYDYDSYTLITSTSGDTMEIQDATGLQVYNSINDAYRG